MSKWFEAKREDIDLDGGEVNIHFDTDYDGACYVTVKVKDLKEVLDV